MEKVFMCYEKESEIYVNEHGDIDSIDCENPIKFQNEYEILKYLIQKRLKEDGQIFRFITDFMNEFIINISEEVIGDKEYLEVNNYYDLQEEDICELILIIVKKIKKNYNKENK